MLLYNFFVLIYGFSIRIASLYAHKARLWLTGRKNLLNKIESELSANHIPLIWIHCSSVGEFEQGRPLLEHIRKQYPHYKLLLTFFSPSGFELRKNYSGADYIYYLPLDTAHQAKQFMDLVNPHLAIFIKYEYWLNYLKECRERNIPHYMVSAIYRPSQIFFKWYGSIFLSALKGFNHLFVQDETSKALLSRYGITNVSVSGDTRFDRVIAIASQNADIPFISSFIGDTLCFIAGSTWPEDEKVLHQSLAEFDNLKNIIVPHEINDAHVQELLRVFPHSIAYSQVRHETDLSGIRTLVFDKLGYLSVLYRYADVVYIGGGFGKGIHNVLEAAVYAKPVIIGPRYDKFKEAKDLIKLGAAIEVNSKDYMKQSMRLLFENESERNNKGAICKKYVEENAGATLKVISKINF
jgi:3-deoxy-D-manno-octulosonic-acid transferase